MGGWGAGGAHQGRERGVGVVLVSLLPESSSQPGQAEARRGGEAGPPAGLLVSGTPRMGPAPATQQPGPAAPASLSPSGLSKNWEDHGCEEGLCWSCEIRS